MNSRFNISTMLLLVAVVAAYFAGRIPLLERTQTAEQKSVEAKNKLETFMQHSEIEIGSSRYAWYSINAELNDAPIWDDKSSAPPLNTCDTIEVCEKVIDQLESRSSATNIEKWRIASLSLIPLDTLPNNQHPERWVYSANFLGLKKGYSAYTSFSIVILMDGSVFIGDDDYETELYDMMSEHYPRLRF